MILATVVFLIVVVIVVWRWYLRDELRDMFIDVFNNHKL